MEEESEPIKKRMGSSTSSQPSIRSHFGCDGFTQSSQTTYSNTDPRAKELHCAVLELIIKDLRPYSIVTGDGFLRYSLAMNKKFKVGSEKFYREKLTKVYENSRTKIMEKLRKDCPDSISVQLDGWSANQHGYIGLIISYIIPSSMKRCNVTLACRRFDTSHTGEALAGWLMEELEQWNISEKFTVLVTDSAANMLKMMEYVPADVHHCRCLNHIMNTVVDSEILEKPETESVIRAVRKVTNYHSTLFSEAVREECRTQNKKELTLIKDVVTRWNSTFDMLER